MAELLLKDEVFAIVGAAMEVRYRLGLGFAEPVYQEALAIEFERRHIAFKAQSPLRICYKGHTLKKKYYADFVCYGQVVVELKVMERLSPREEAQLINYLKVTGIRVGLLLNFGSPGRVEWRRMVV